MLVVADDNSQMWTDDERRERSDDADLTSVDSASDVEDDVRGQAVLVDRSVAAIRTLVTYSTSTRIAGRWVNPQKTKHFVILSENARKNVLLGICSAKP